MTTNGPISLDETDIEPEETEESTPSCQFDSRSIDVTPKTANLGTILEMFNAELINLSPEFQRESNLWKPEEKSRLIESVILGLPLPSFFFSERREEPFAWDVIDGQQRLQTFKDFFIDNKLKLRGLEFLGEHYTGKTCADFTPKELWRMKMLQLNLNVISRKTPDQVKFILFKRVNTSNYSLSEQEMRHALLQGKPSTFVKELAELESFKEATRPTKFARMQDRELVTRYLSFRLLKNKDPKLTMSDFLFEGMSKLKELSVDDLDREKAIFDSVMIVAQKICYGVPFRKLTLDGNDCYQENRRNPLCKPLFEALSTTLAELPQDSLQRLSDLKDSFFSQYKCLFRKNSAFYDSISIGTASQEAIQTRRNTLQEIIKSILN